MKYLVDTDWVIEYLKGREPVVTLLAEWAPVGLAIDNAPFCSSARTPAQPQLSDR
jgi:hypothetical protein